MGFALVDIGLAFVSNAKVQEAAGKAFDAVYSRIFKDQSPKKPFPTIELKPVSVEQQMVLDRLASIDSRLDSMPNDTEIARAFSVLQAELRAGQNRLWYIIVPLFIVNFAILALIYFSR